MRVFTCNGCGKTLPVTKMLYSIDCFGDRYNYDREEEYCIDCEVLDPELADIGYLSTIDDFMDVVVYQHIWEKCTESEYWNLWFLAEEFGIEDKLVKLDFVGNKDVDLSLYSTSRESKILEEWCQKTYDLIYKHIEEFLY